MVVMGNEAGDLCSLTSALGYSWLRSNTSGKAIAFITTPREDFMLRAENLYALGLAGINQPFEELYCSSDPMPSQVSQFALVDHNVLHTSYASPTARVVAVIDHHEDEGQYKDTADPRVVEPAGNYINHQFFSIPPELSTLLLSPVLIDTRGLKEGGKAIDGRIQSLSTTSGEKKLSVSHLSTRDLLRRDYKEYTFTTPASDNAVQSSNVIAVGLATLAERDLSILGMLTTFRNKKGKGGGEQLWIIKTGDEGIAEKLWEGLEASEELELKRLDFSNAVRGVIYCEAYKQGNTDSTRKQTAPILRRLM
ncbi:hypothetical protein DEU56DRAFT_871761 [Suillus clintonianus]|uniref:uncharacterized protein n=1 Tax=Suillus clintonianus TaxID=1904413 RepID=UPI001B866108|nr:uncharacterized protein DEU56DRAFT_871761 [Suillus clintonianus]KAG2135168.1 hypothetical protein DEU56DRAFT_871761 [Suillus clintonianus]